MSNGDELRRTAYQLVARAMGDPDFAAHVKANPQSVLRDAGLPDDALTVPVPELWCRDFTCWSSECPGTCYVSF